MSMHKDDVNEIAGMLQSVTLSGNEAIAFATAMSLMANELKKLKPTEDYIEYTNIPSNVWKNIQALMERVSLTGDMVNRYLDLVGKVQNASMATPAPTNVAELTEKTPVEEPKTMSEMGLKKHLDEDLGPDAEEFINGDGDEQEGNRGEN